MHSDSNITPTPIPDPQLCYGGGGRGVIKIKKIECRSGVLFGLMPGN